MLESRDYEAAERELLRRRARERCRTNRSGTKRLRSGKKARVAADCRGEENGPVRALTVVVTVIAVELGVR
jgi:hypothetical protein